MLVKIQFGLAALIAGGTLCSCARPTSTRPFAPPDVKIDHPVVHPPVDSQRPIRIHLPSGDYSSGNLFSLVPLAVGQSLTEPGSLRKYFEAFYWGENTFSSTKFSESPFGEFLIEHSITPFVMNTYNLDEQKNTQLLNVRLLLQRRSWYLKQSSIHMRTGNLVYLAQRYIDQTLSDFAIGKLEPKIREGVIAGIKSFQEKTLHPVTATLRSFDLTPRLDEALKILSQLTQEMNITLEPETQEQFKAAETIARRISRTKDEKSALALLVEVWDQMPAKDRGPVFQRASRDLYKFMKDSSQADRNCLKGIECTGIGTQIAKHLFILPAIKDYGIDRMRDQIEAEVLKTMKIGVQRMIRDSLIELPWLLLAEIKGQIDQEFDRIEGYTEDYPSFVRNELNAWYRSQFGTSFIPAIESESFGLENRRLGPHISGSKDQRGRLTVSAHAFGQILQSTAHWPEDMGFIRSSQDNKNLILLGLVRANQILGFEGMLHTQDNQEVPSEEQLENWHLVESSQPVERLLPLSFFPLRASLIAGFGLSRRSHLPSLDISGQASLLRGFVSLARVFNDWQPTTLGHVMSSIRVKDMITNLPSDALDVPAFSQDVMLAKALNNAGLILKTLKSKGTPLVQICEDNNPRWFDQEEECQWPTTLAGLVDIKDGIRSMEIKTKSTSAFLIALIEFIRFCEEELPKTKSKYLLESMIPNRPPAMEEIQQVLPELRNLAVGLTHMLTQRLQGPNGRFRSLVRLDRETNVDSGTDFETQILGLQAVSMSAHLFQVGVYKSSARAAYSYLNQNLWNSSTGFYQGQGPRPSLAEAMLAREALGQFLPLLDETDGREQLQLYLKGLFVSN